jgi:hypothetical protein
MSNRINFGLLKFSQAKFGKENVDVSHKPSERINTRVYYSNHGVLPFNSREVKTRAFLARCPIHETTMNKRYRQRLFIVF